MARPYAKQRKEEPEPGDVFVEQVVRLTAWAREHMTLVVLLSALLGLGVAGFFYYRNYQASVAERAAVELQELGATLPQMETEAAIGEVRAFLDRYRGTAAAQEGRVLLGRVLLETGRPADAVETLRPLLDRGAETPIGYAARRLVAAAHEASGETDAALGQLAELARGARLAFQRRAASADRARLLLEAGRFQEAGDLYRELAARAEEAGAAEEAALYRLRAGEASARAAPPPPEPADDRAPADEAGG